LKVKVYCNMKKVNSCPAIASDFCHLIYRQLTIASKYVLPIFHRHHGISFSIYSFQMSINLETLMQSPPYCQRNFCMHTVSKFLENIYLFFYHVHNVFSINCPINCHIFPYPYTPRPIIVFLQHCANTED
jgi:hypothetical protein